jgi:hypothetical protein
MEDRLVVPLACSQALDVLGEALDAILHDDVDEVQRELARRLQFAGARTTRVAGLGSRQLLS